MSEPIKALTIDDLKTKVVNYRNFAAKAIAPADVFMSAVFHKDVIRQILEGVPDQGGVRIYMAKDSASDATHDVSYLLVPVAKEADGSYTDQIVDGHEHLTSGLVAMADCIGKLCNGSALIDVEA